MTKRLILLLLIALQPAALVAAQAMPTHRPAQANAQASAEQPNCCEPDCTACLVSQCPCDIDGPEDRTPQPQPATPAPERTRLADLFTPSQPLPTTQHAIEQRLIYAAPNHAHALPTGVGQRLSFLCLWLT